MRLHIQIVLGVVGTIALIDWDKIYRATGLSCG